MRTNEHPPGPPAEHPEQHPEEWLDLALAGRLMPPERALLDRHLAMCAACATHLQVAASSASAASPGSYDDRRDRWAVERVMAGLPSRASPRWWRLSPRWASLCAAVLLFLATAVSAKLWKAKQASSASIQADGTAGVRPPRRVQTSQVIATDPAPEELMPDGPHHGVAKMPLPRLPKHSPRLTAAELFEQARQLGNKGRLDAAVAIHLRLQRIYPDTAEAGLSSALAGRLLLYRDRPAEALAQFDRHLARRGAADEEALAGRAAALQKLNRHVEEATAWRTLLARHPGSVYADGARARLRDLSSP